MMTMNNKKKDKDYDEMAEKKLPLFHSINDENSKCENLQHYFEIIRLLFIYLFIYLLLQWKSA